MNNTATELTPAQEQYLQQVMDNTDHLSVDQINELLERINPPAATVTANQ